MGVNNANTIDSRSVMNSNILSGNRQYSLPVYILGIGSSQFDSIFLMGKT